MEHARKLGMRRDEGQFNASSNDLRGWIGNCSSTARSQAIARMVNGLVCVYISVGKSDKAKVCRRRQGPLSVLLVAV
jgi:hypothetical protein